MAWNVVIAGGGFGGARAARQLERLMPKQSARLLLVNDVNFMLYTPFLPEAAAGTLEPRHVVTPLREMLSRTYLRLGAIDAHDPEARTVELRTHEGETEQLRYDQLLLALGSVSRVRGRTRMRAVAVACITSAGSAAVSASHDAAYLSDRFRPIWACRYRQRNAPRFLVWEFCFPATAGRGVSGQGIRT